MVSSEGSGRRWRGPLLASAWSMFVSGFPVALGSVTSDVKPVLLGAFVTYSGARMLAMKISLVVAGLLYDSRREQSVLLGVVGYFCLLGLALVGLSLAESSHLLLLIGNLLTGASMGILYLLGVMLPTEWLPERPGVAVGISMTSYVAGTIVGTELLALGTRVISLPSCLMVTSVALTLFGVASARHLRAQEKPSALSRHEGGAAHRREGFSILKTKEAWLFLFVVSVAQGPPWAFIDAFNSLVVDFLEFSLAESRALFSALNVLGLLVRLSSGFVADLIGLRALTIASMLFLVLSFVTLRLQGRLSWPPLLVVGIAFQWIPLSSVATAAVLIARAVFGSEDAGLAFGLAKGSSGFFIMLFSVFTARVVDAPTDVRWTEFARYCDLGIVTGTLGVLAAASLPDRRRHPRPSEAPEAAEERPLLVAQGEEDGKWNGAGWSSAVK